MLRIGVKLIRVGLMFIHGIVFGPQYVTTSRHPANFINGPICLHKSVNELYISTCLKHAAVNSCRGFGRRREVI